MGVLRARMRVAARRVTPRSRQDAGSGSHLDGVAASLFRYEASLDQLLVCEGRCLAKRATGHLSPPGRGPRAACSSCPPARPSEEPSVNTCRQWGDVAGSTTASRGLRWVQTAVLVHSTWYWCPHGGSLRTSSPCLKGSKQTTHSSIWPPSTLSSRTVRGKESTADSTAASCASVAAAKRRSSACTDLSWARRWREARPKVQTRMQRTTARHIVGSAHRPVESTHRVIGKFGG